MDIPDGFIKIQLKIDKKGNFKRQLIREGKSVCKLGDDKSLLDDLLNVEIPGFIGKFGEVDDNGKTQEYYEQTRPKVSPIKHDEEEFKVNKPQRKLDQGYGV